MDAHVPFTSAMSMRLDKLDPNAKVVGVQHGLPVLVFPSGRRLVLTTTGHLERA